MIEISESKTLHCLKNTVSVKVEEREKKVYITVSNEPRTDVYIKYPKGGYFMPLSDLLRHHEEWREYHKKEYGYYP